MPAATAKMGSHSDKMSVVDSDLKVKGVKGLRVIDQSIIPEIVSGSLTATIMMIAEKGADLIRGKTLTKPIPPVETLLSNPPIPMIQGNYEIAVWPPYQVNSKKKKEPNHNRIEFESESGQDKKVSIY